MYYISRKVGSSAYYIKDTEDGVEELYNLGQIQNFIEMGFKINGVSDGLVYVSSDAPFKCYMGDSVSESSIKGVVVNTFLVSSGSLYVYNSKTGKMDLHERINAVFSNDHSVYKVYGAGSDKLLCPSAYMVRDYSYVGSGASGDAFDESLVAGRRRYRRDGIFYEVWGLTGESRKLLNPSKDDLVLLDTIVSNSRMFQNVKLDGDLVTVAGLDGVVVYNMEIARKVYKRTVSKSSKLNAAKSQLMNRTPVYVYDNGILQHVVCKENTLVLPEDVRVVPYHSIDFEKRDDIRVVFGDGIRRIYKDFLDITPHSYNIKFYINKMSKSNINKMLPTSVPCKDNVYIECSDVDTMGVLLLALFHDKLFKNKLKGEENVFDVVSKYTNISDYTDCENASRIMGYVIKELNLPDTLPEFINIGGRNLYNALLYPDMLLWGGVIPKYEEYPTLKRLYDTFRHVTNSGEWCDIV